MPQTARGPADQEKIPGGQFGRTVKNLKMNMLLDSLLAMYSKELISRTF